MHNLLPHWNDTPLRAVILEFLTAVSTPGSPDFIPPAARIATFDNDGTLWCEKPAYIQLYFAIQRLQELAAKEPTLLDQPGYRAAAAGDLAYFGGLYPDNVAELAKLVYDTHSDMTQDEFKALAYRFLTQEIHPRFGVPFKQLAYQPMIELVRCLEAHDFKVFIATAGGMSFVRTVAEEIYGIPPEHVIGSNVSFEMRLGDDGPVIYRKPGLIDPISDGPGKPVAIELHIGRKPVIAVGNADGDLHMFMYSETNSYRSLQLLLNHDDAEREYAYQARAERVLQMAAERPWQVISMQQDFARVFDHP